jgi:hypothetical protein
MPCLSPPPSDKVSKSSDEAVQVRRWTLRLCIEEFTSWSSSGSKDIDLSEMAPAAGRQNGLCWTRLGVCLHSSLPTRANCDRAESLSQVCKVRSEAANSRGFSIVPPDSAPETKGAISWEYPGSSPEYRWLRVVRVIAGVLFTLTNDLFLLLSSSI